MYARTHFQLKGNFLLQKVVFSLLIFILSIGAGYAQHYPRKKFTIRDGLPQSQVQDVLQLPDGHIWLTTKGGIARFDGKVFESFGTREGYHPDQYRQLLLQNDSTLFLGVQRGVAQWFHMNRKRFSNVRIQPESGNWNSWDILPDLNGGLLYASRAEPEKKANPIWMLGDTGLVQSEEYQYLNGVVNGVKSCALDKSDSSLWIFDFNDGLYRLKDGRHQKMHQVNSEVRKGHIQFIQNNDNTLLAFVPSEHTLYALDSTGVTVHKVFPELEEVWKTQTNSYLVLDGNGHYFLLVDQKQVWALFNAESSWVLIDEFNLVYDLYIDYENNLYVADEGALYVYNNFAFSHFTPEKEGIPKYIWTVVEDDQLRLWLGSHGHGLNIWDREANVFFDITRKAVTDKGSFPLETVYMGGVKDQNNRIIIPGSGPVYVFNQDGTIEKKLHNDNQPTLILWEDTLQKLIYAGTTGGVYVFDENYNRVDHLDDTSVTHRPVVSMAKDQQGNLWMGTWERIICYDGRDFTQPFDTIGDKSISAVATFADRRGNVWFGGHQGLFYFDGENLNGIEKKLFKSFISFIVEMDEHQLLVGLVDGVAVLDLGKYFSGELDWYHYYGEELGFTGIEPGQNGAVRTQDGKVWITTTDQITLFDPELLKSQGENRIKMQVASVQGIGHEGEDGGWETQFSNTEKHHQIEVPYTTNRLRINFKAINHTSPNDIEYNYRLVGFDEEWSPSYDERFAEYTRLKPGKYTFEVKAQHKNQPAPEQPAMASFSFIIPTPFYLSWWFFVIVVLLGAAAVSYTTVVIVRNRKIKREQDDLLKLEMCQLQYRALKAQVEPHFASNLLNSVNAAILKEDKLEASRVLSHFARLIRDILQHNDRMVYSLKEELDFIKLYIDLERNVLRDKLQYVVQIAPEVDLEREIPVMLLHTFVENSIKHAIRPNRESGLIQLTLAQKPSGLQIEISDTGSGNQPDTTLIKGAGKGVSLVDRIMEIHNRRNKQKMTIRIEDHDSGRKVLIYIPESFIFGSPEPMTQ